MKKIETTQAVGHVLCHDITRIIKDVTKDTAFRKGHIVTAEDVPVLLSLGKEHLYVWEHAEGMLHENEAAQELCKLCQNDHMQASPVKEGKIELTAQEDGLFMVDVTRLDAINAIEELMIATRHGFFPVKKGDKLAGTRVIPLVIDKEKLQQAHEAAGEEPILKLIPYKGMKAGIVTTGSEVFHGRIKDTFTPVIIAKLKEYGIEVMAHCIVDDNSAQIAQTIKEMIAQGVEMVLCTGGMSVDPDDLTPSAIAATGATIVSYGAPVLPGAMFLLAYYEDRLPIMGLPGCVMYAKATIFDLVLPRVAAGVKLTKKDLSTMGHGGLCLQCGQCIFPNCGFGKGMMMHV